MVSFCPFPKYYVYMKEDDDFSPIWSQSKLWEMNRQYISNLVQYASSWKTTANFFSHHHHCMQNFYEKCNVILSSDIHDSSKLLFYNDYLEKTFLKTKCIHYFLCDTVQQWEYFLKYKLFSPFESLEELNSDYELAWKQRSKINNRKKKSKLPFLKKIQNYFQK